VHPFKLKNAPALRPGRFILYTLVPKNCSGSTPLLILCFLLTFVLSLAVLRWILLGNVLWRVLALISL
jgi:hypothetical protein